MNSTPGPLRPDHVAGRPLSAVASSLRDAGFPAQRHGDADPHLSGVSLDSRTIGPGEMYVALPGTRSHGAAFAPGARERGATAALTDAAGVRACLDAGLPVIEVDDPRPAMAVAAAEVFGHPADRLLTIGITGTNGKTTTSFFVEAGLLAAGRHPGSIGTIGFRLDGEPLPDAARTTITTPESPDLQALLAVFAERGADSAVMEVSSHALALHRVDGIHYSASAFLNLGRDHLDFHPTMEDYFLTKAKLFEGERTGVAVVTTDDDYGRRLAAMITAAGAPRLVSTGFDEGCDYRIVSWTPQGPGSAVVADTPAGRKEFTISLPGDYNVRNAVTALALLAESGLDPDAVIPGLAIAQVPGRMQLVALGEGAPHAYVDFAHTPQAITAALSAVSGHPLVAVLGAGGDRDTAKRGPMGAAAASGADIVIVTDDNPRTEDPAAIRAAVTAGAREGTAEVIEIADRAEAIAEGLRRAGADGVLAVLGKGHERGQQVGDQVIPFDDAAAVRAAWQRQGDR